MSSLTGPRISGVTSTPPMSPAEKRYAYDRVTTEQIAEEKWVPGTVKPFAAFGFCVTLLCLAVLIELLWVFNTRNQGWATNGTSWSAGIYHLILTYVPNLFINTILLARILETDYAFRTLQPYVELSHGHVPPSKSLTLNYLAASKLDILRPAFSNKHFLIMLSTGVVLFASFTLTFAGSLLISRPTLISRPGHIVQAKGSLGLDPDWTTLTPFLTAAGYAEAAALYQLPDPPFVKNDWVVGAMELPTGLNGTMTAPTTGIQVDSGCELADVPSIRPYANNTGYTLTGTWSDCSATFEIQSSSPVQFAAEPLVLTTCTPTSEIIAGGTPEDKFKPIVFYMFSSIDPPNQNPPNSILVFCKPSMKIYDVEITVDLVTRQLLDVRVLGNYTGVNDVTGGTFKGRLLNGIVFDPTTDVTLLARAQATKTGLPGAVYQAAHESPGGLTALFQNQGLLKLFNKVYTQYLVLTAKAVYFNEVPSVTATDLWVYEERIWVATAPAQILVGSLVLIALTLIFMHIRHIRGRRNLYLANEPGSIASIMALSSGSDVPNLLHPRYDEDMINKTLDGRFFSLDRETGRIVST